jgi:hypothetical protein
MLEDVIGMVSAVSTGIGYPPCRMNSAYFFTAAERLRYRESVILINLRIKLHC